METKSHFVYVAGANNAGSATATADAADATGTGISEKDIEAAENGGLTPADTPTDSDSLGLQIEYALSIYNIRKD